jgi:hypothetical protein
MPYDISTTTSPHTRFLPRRSLLVLDDAAGTTVTVDRGELWVTLEADPRDLILVKGMKFEIDRGGRTILAAEQDSWLRVVRPTTLSERLRAWLGRAKTAITRSWLRQAQSRRVQYY